MTKKAIREEVVSVRMTAAQRRVLEAAAGAAGLNVSTWMRLLAIQAAGGK